MNEKQLIKCTRCTLGGRDVVLGALDPQGHYFAILGHKRSILIVGDRFGAYCGKCGDLVYFKDSAAKQDLLRVQVLTTQGGSL